MNEPGRLNEPGKLNEPGEKKNEPGTLTKPRRQRLKGILGHRRSMPVCTVKVSNLATPDFTSGT